MGISTERLNYLLQAYSEGTISLLEHQELFREINDGDHTQLINNFLNMRLLAQPDTQSKQGADIDWPAMFNKIVEPVTTEPTAPHTGSILSVKWLRYAAVAVLVLSVGFAFWPKKQAKQPEVSANLPQTDVEAPSGNKAILTLSNGSTIILENAADGELAHQGNTQIVKSANGQIEYKIVKESGKKIETPAFNTMSTPRGSEYQLILPDGSKVWLNAASSITYPVYFVGNERKVSITGEVYFEVTRDIKKPFKVNVNGQSEIEVLGTIFNVNAYTDGPSFKTSLLKGSVKVNQKIIKPGQAYLDGNIVKTDLDQDIAWKNGVFNFHKLELKEVMRQIARWYDIEVIYEGNIPKTHFFGEMGRDLSLSQVLKGLHGSGLNFRIERGKRLIVNI